MAEFEGTIAIRNNPVAYDYPYSFVFTRGVGDEPGYSQLTFDSRAEGGYHRASFSIRESRDLLAELLTTAACSEVLIYDDETNMVWEGYVHDVELDMGRVVYRANLSDMANAVWVRYRIRGGTTTARSAIQTDANSIARYGRREFVLSAGELESSDTADDIALTYLNSHAWPNPSPVRVSPKADLAEFPVMNMNCRGWFDTLNWCVYNQTVSTDSQGATAQVSTIIADTNVTQFVSAAEYESNATSVSKEYDADRRGGDIIRDIGRLGDRDNNRWIAKMTAGRKFVFTFASPPTEPD